MSSGQRCTGHKHDCSCRNLSHVHCLCMCPVPSLESFVQLPSADTCQHTLDFRPRVHLLLHKVVPSLQCCIDIRVDPSLYSLSRQQFATRALCFANAGHQLCLRPIRVYPHRPSLRLHTGDVVGRVQPCIERSGQSVVVQQSGGHVHHVVQLLASHGVAHPGYERLGGVQQPHATNGFAQRALAPLPL